MAGKLIERIKYWSQILLLPLYGLAFLIPRNKKIWLFGSTFGRRYADSPRYLYLYINQHREELKKQGIEIRPIWISENDEIIRVLTEAGYEAYKRGTLPAIWYCLIGKVYLYDNYPKDISHWLSGGAVKINLWHGLPLKKIQNDNIFDKIRHPGNLYERWKAFPRRLSDEKKTHYVLATSEFIRPVFASAFKTERVIVNGYPRNDIFATDEIENVLLPDEAESAEEIRKRKGEGTKVFFYMPTFRDSESAFFDTVDIDLLNRFLDENNYLLCLKLHCKSKLKAAFDAIESDRIVVINQTADPYVFVGDADVMIGDYSSAYFDYLLTDRPIVFFDYDLEEYLKNSREMYFDYEEFTPGIKAETFEELKAAMLRSVEHPEEYRKQRAVIREKSFVKQEGSSSSNLVRWIMSILYH